MSGRERIWRAVDPNLFRFTTTDLRDLHVALMTAFEESAVLAPALAYDQVRVALTANGWDEVTPDEVLQRALASLVDWGLLEATQDHAAHYGSPEEFERKNLQWSLSRRGEAAVGGLLAALDYLRHAVGLQPAVLDAIGDGLGELSELLARPTDPATDARIHIRLAEVEGHLTSLVTSVRQFNGHLQRLLREDAEDEEVFSDVKRRTISYLKEYVDGVERPKRRLLGLVDRLEEAGVATMFDRALGGANLAPVGGDDPGPLWLSERLRRWGALRAWFAPLDGSAGRIDGLLDIARTAIIELLRVIERRWDSRRRSTSIAADFRRLSQLFADAPGDTEAHLLFGAAFGLWSSRHAHLIAEDGEERSPATPWAVAEPVDVAPALRTSGVLTNIGRSRAIGDPAVVRAGKQRREVAALAAHESLRGALETGGRVRLSAFGVLPVDSFSELLSLLALGMSAPEGLDGVRSALSVDGRVEIELRDAGDGARASVHCDDGVITGPDLLVSISMIGGVGEGARAGGGVGARAGGGVDDADAPGGDEDEAGAAEQSAVANA